MNPPKTRIDRQSDTFLQQRGAMPALIERLRAAAPDEITLGMISEYMGILPRKD